MKQQILVALQSGDVSPVKALSAKLCRDYPGDEDVWLLMGVVFRQLNDLPQAQASLRTAVGIRPMFPSALYQLGMVQHALGFLGEAEASLQKAVAGQPGFVDAYTGLGAVMLARERAGQAIAYLKQALRIAPLHVEALFILGACYLACEEPEEAVKCYRQASQLAPDSVKVLVQLGVALLACHDYQEAIDCLVRALRLAPELAITHYNLGLAYSAINKPVQGMEHYRRSVELQPDLHEAWGNLGLLLVEAGDENGAMDCFQQAVNHKPDYAEGYLNLGYAWNGKNNQQQALECYRKAIDCQPDLAAAWKALGSLYRDLHNYTDAEQATRKAIELDPQSITTRMNLAALLLCQARHDEAETVCREALEIQPDAVEVGSNLLSTLNYTDRDPVAVYQEHLAWGRRHEVASRHDCYDIEADPGKKLRIGYVSPDFRLHSVAYFVEALFRVSDPGKFEVVGYAQLREPDSMTRHLRSLAGDWRMIADKSDAEVSQLIRDDRIDILVDLAGHTSDHRLKVFTHSPAPIQISYLGYPNTTGLACMDYRLTDAIADPEDRPGLCSETLFRLPGCFLCFTPPDSSIPVGRLPALENGYITFGSFNNLAKVTPDVVSLWADIMGSVPGSRLLLKNRSLADESIRRRYLEMFSDAGIEASRLKLVGLTPGREEHLAMYHSVDIGLDPFPYNGTTTTCEALWMGVPVVTFAGDVHASRVGSSLLNAVGLEQYVARDTQDYREMARRLSGDLVELERLRCGLRERVESSILCAQPEFTRALEDAYRSMWQDWCAKMKQPGDL